MPSNKAQITASGEIQKIWGIFHQPADKHNWSEVSRQKRLDSLLAYTGVTIPNLSQTHLASQELEGNIENFIGSVEVPVGLGGPLLFAGSHVQGPIFAPLATSEGALVASTCRGAKLLNACGGVTTRFLSSQITRAPAFSCRSTDEALRLAQWVSEHFEFLRDAVKEPYATLQRIEPIVHGRSLSLQFFYDTGNAAGQNMSTIATWDSCLWIVENAKNADIHIQRYTIEGGFSGDKKLSLNNFSQGRGSRVIAEAWIAEEHLQNIMRISSQDLLKNYLCDTPNYFLNGSVACNSNVANIVAAMFTATGQDIACVHESSLGQISIEIDEGGVYVSVLMPCLVVGTVGGGTRLPSQNEALRLMGCQGPNSKERLAEIITGYCLALEMSTLSAAIEGTFVQAHSQLGRQHR